MGRGRPVASGLGRTGSGDGEESGVGGVSPPSSQIRWCGGRLRRQLPPVTIYLIPLTKCHKVNCSTVSNITSMAVTCDSGGVRRLSPAVECTAAATAGDNLGSIGGG
nr:uncharacterized protein LOC107280805 [Oryza sativa Japonica Group]